MEVIMRIKEKKIQHEENLNNKSQALLLNAPQRIITNNPQFFFNVSSCRISIFLCYFFVGC